MNYELQVIKGRSASTSLKLIDGITSVGRHDDCSIRIKSSQVSRRHCEIFEAAGKLTLRDLGSSNGTFVNGKRVMGQQPLKLGDEIQIGAVTLRVAKVGQPAPAGQAKPKAGDTAVFDAVAVDEDDHEFEMEFDDDSESAVDAIPLADELPTPPAPPKSPAKAAKAAAAPDDAPTEVVPSAKPKAGKAGKGDDAIADFLLDLNLDDEE
jgi:predicted component of type VI protein secretion system